MRQIEHVELSSLDEYIQELLPRQGFRRTAIYRGQASHSWKLLPSLLRLPLADTEFSSWSEMESALLSEFKRIGRSELGYQPQSELEWMTAGARNGLPTRLSAWTQNGLTALFFACQEGREFEDGVVYRLIPGDESLLISQDYEAAPDKLNLYHSTNPSSAMRAQDTAFLVQPLPESDALPETVEELYQLDRESLALAKIRIPATEKPELLRQLSRLGVNHQSLFPGLRGLCGQLTSQLFEGAPTYGWAMD